MFVLVRPVACNDLLSLCSAIIYLQRTLTFKVCSTKLCLIQFSCRGAFSCSMLCPAAFYCVVPKDTRCSDLACLAHLNSPSRPHARSKNNSKLITHPLELDASELLSHKNVMTKPFGCNPPSFCLRRTAQF